MGNACEEAGCDCVDATACPNCGWADSDFGQPLFRVFPTITRTRGRISPNGKDPLQQGLASHWPRRDFSRPLCLGEQRQLVRRRAGLGERSRDTFRNTIFCSVPACRHGQARCGRLPRCWWQQPTSTLPPPVRLSRRRSEAGGLGLPVSCVCWPGAFRLTPGTASVRHRAG